MLRSLRNALPAAALLTALTAIFGCSSASTNAPASTGGSGSAYLTLSANSLTFPNTAVNATSAAQTVTLTNTGSASATVSSYSLTGNTVDFNQAATTCGTSLAAGASCTFSITFTPQAQGTFTLTITATDNASNSPQALTLTGTGTATAVPQPTAGLTPPTITFPTTAATVTASAINATLTNSGTAALAIASINLGGANAAQFNQTNNCGSSLGISSSCTIAITFTPAAASTSYAATLTVTDNTGNVANSTQTVSLSGASSAPANVPVAGLSPSTLTFPATALNTAASAQGVTLSNTGAATLTGISINITGANPSSFSYTTNCGTTLNPSSSCSISVGFTPLANGALSAKLSVADNASGSPQQVSLYGTGGLTSTTRQFYVFPESDNSATPLYALVNGATKTIDMTMYALQDTTFSTDLVAACQRGVTVRVVLDQNNEKSNDTAAFNQLNAQSGCTAVWANKAFQVTHEKSFIVDGATVAIMSLNLQSQYYSTTRDYALVENDTNDIAAVQATFNQDFAAGTTASGTVGTSDYSYQPPAGDDLVWSPTTATANMLAIINNATTTLYIENEEFSASNIVSAIAAAANRGVKVIFVGEYSSSYVSNYSTIKTAGASVYYYSSSTGFYVHGKAVVADLGLSTEAVYMGSINYSTASLTQNRELGIYITGNTAVSNPIASTIAATIVSDESQSGVTHY